MPPRDRVRRGAPGGLTDVSAPPRVVVTGAGGFVGMFLVPALKNAGWTVESWGRSGPDGVDVRDAAVVRARLAAARPSAIVHLAGVTHLPKVLEDPDAALLVNVGGAANVLDAARRETPAARVLVVSSCAVYGAPKPENLPLDEDAPLLAEHPYGVQKIAVECLADRAREDFGLDVVVVRPFNHLGPGQEPRFAASWFASQIARIEAGLADPVLRVGNLEPKRDMLDVRDVVRAYVSLLRPGAPRGIFNVARGESTRIGWVLDWFVKHSTAAVTIESEPALFRKMDAPDLSGSCARLHAAIGWAPLIPLDDTLSMILDDARRRAAPAEPPR
jgi:GDP-4-dehydro-6-deoxy-D-mannose reductase